MTHLSVGWLRPGEGWDRRGLVVGTFLRESECECEWVIKAALKKRPQTTTYIGDHRNIPGLSHDRLDMATSFRSENSCHPITNHFGYGTGWDDGVATRVVPTQHERDIWQNIWIIIDFFCNYLIN